MNKKILITGHAGSQNRGCEMILRGTIEILRRYIKSVDISLNSRMPQSDRVALRGEKADGIRIYDNDSYSEKGMKRFSFQWFVTRRNRITLKGFNPLFFQGILPFDKDTYINKDVVIHIGGDNFCYDHLAKESFAGLHLAKLNGAQTVIWAASIGPFHPKDENKFAKELRKVDLITVREELSNEYLQKIGVKENVRSVSDPGFLIQASSDGALHIARIKEDIIIGINMSDLISDHALNRQDYLESFTTFTKDLLSNTNIKLVLIPHVIYHWRGWNDLAICEALANRLNMPDRVIMLGDNHNASQTKYVISQCDYFIGARTHSTISSLSSGVPTLSIAYSQKAYGINQKMFGHTNYVIPISSLSGGVLLEKFNLLRHDRQKIVEQLIKLMPIVREEADNGGRYLAELLHV
ncbi:MAG: polysaccharide pyruvyl transferase family protein [Smithella sp.]|jgi:polysaccharide pyruvyl transferase WcaK-like protein